MKIIVFVSAYRKNRADPLPYFVPARNNYVINKKGLATTYSHAAVHGTTIGGGRLNERVRNGNVCFPLTYDHQAKYLSHHGRFLRNIPMRHKIV